MDEDNLEEMLKRVWMEVREAFWYPPLPDPVFMDPIPAPAGMDMQNHFNTFVSKAFLGYLTEVGPADTETILTGLLLHEANHYVTCPKDFKGYLELFSASRHATWGKQHGVDMAKNAVNYYADVVVNTDITVVMDRHEVTEIYRIMYSPEMSVHPKLGPAIRASEPINRIMGGLYQELWECDLGIVPIEEERAIIDELKGIDYLHSDNRKEDVREFTRIILPVMQEMIEKQKEMQKEQKKKKKDQKGKQQQDQQGDPSSSSSGEECEEGEEGDEQGEPQSGPGGEGDEDMFSDGLLDNIDPSSFSDDEIEEGLREFAEEENQNDFADAMHDLDLDERLYGEKDKKSTGYIPIKRGKEGLLAQIQFYSALAKKYDLPIKTQEIHKDGSLYPHSHTKYQLGDDLQRVDPFNSMGKVIPGLSNRWQMKESETVGQKEGVPDAIICIDSSGSMINPSGDSINTGRISPAVLGAFCAADAYLANDAKVAVVNFSASTNRTDFIDDTKTLYKLICSYQGEGTQLRTEAIDELVEMATDKVDIILITDMAIFNIGEVLQNLSEHTKTNRLTVVSLHSPGAVSQYGNYEGESLRNVKMLQNQLGDSDNVGFYHVKSTDDIAKIILGETTKSFGMK